MLLINYELLMCFSIRSILHLFSFISQYCLRCFIFLDCLANYLVKCKQMTAYIDSIYANREHVSLQQLVVFTIQYTHILFSLYYHVERL